MKAKTIQLRDKLLSEFELTPESQRVSVELYRQLAAGRSVRPADVAEALCIPVTRVEAILAQTTLSAAEHDEAGRIVSFGGLSLPPTPHKFQVDEQALYTWCAFDALFLQRVLGMRAQVESTCPVSGREIRFTVTSNGIGECIPEAPFMSLVTPDAERLKDSVRQSFCCHVNFFASAEAASAWTSDRERTVALPLAEALEVARSFADRLFGTTARTGHCGDGYSWEGGFR